MNFEQFLAHNDLANRPSILDSDFESKLERLSTLDDRLLMAYELSEQQGLVSFHDVVLKRMAADAEWRRVDARIGKAMADFQRYMTGCYLDSTQRTLSAEQKQILDLLVAYEVLSLNLTFLRSELQDLHGFEADVAHDLLCVLFPSSIFADEEE